LPDGAARGCHLIEAAVRPTLEVVLTGSPKDLRRTFRPELGLALIDPK
jgi:predicted DNA-binding protein with PD1-like motif